MSPAPSPVDPRAIVAEIEAEVVRRRAAGDYPGPLLDRLSAEFHIVRDDEPVEALAYIQTHRAPVNRLPVVGRGIVFSKRLIRRAVAWYVQPIALQQTSFNLAAVRELRGLQRRVERLETPWQRPPRAPRTADAPAGIAARARAFAAAVTGPQGRVLLLPGLAPGLATALTEHAPALADRLVLVDDDPVAALRMRPSASVAAVIAPATLPMLTPADLLEIVALAASRLIVGGVLAIDAPQPPAGDAMTDPSSLDPALRRWLHPETVTLLCEAAGLQVAHCGEATGGWYGLSAVRGSR